MSILDSHKFRGLIEITSAVAVVLGLVFVGLELRQNTAALSAQAILQINDSSNESHRALAQDPKLAELLYKGYEDPQSLSDLERRMFTHWMQVRFNLAESAWLFHKKGLIDQGEFEGVKGSICDRLSKKGVRWFWENASGFYAKGFVEDVNQWCL